MSSFDSVFYEVDEKKQQHRKHEALRTPKLPEDDSDNTTVVKVNPNDPTAIEANEGLTAHNTILWMTYDCADTFWNTTNITAMSPYAILLGLTQGYSYGSTFQFISIFLAISNFFIALSAPFLGAISDMCSTRKVPVMICASIFVTISFLIPTYMNLWWTLVLWIFANYSYQLGRNFYDSQIPFVTASGNRQIIQAIGGGLSFFGALFSIGLSITIKIFWGQWTAVSDNFPDTTLLSYGGIRQFFWFSQAFLLVMLFPYLFHHEKRSPPSKIDKLEIIKSSGRSTLKTLKEIVGDRNGLLFSIAWFLITDAASAGQTFLPLMMQGAAGLTAAETDYNFLVGIPASIIGGLSIGLPLRKFGCRICLILTAIFNVIAEALFMLAIYRVGKWTTYVASIFSGMALGFIWIVGRQFIIELSPPIKLTQWGGFQRISGRVGSVFSPLIYSAVVKALSDTHSVSFSYFIAVLIRTSLFIVGAIVTWFIRDPHKRYLTGERAPYAGIYEKDGTKPRKTAKSPDVTMEESANAVEMSELGKSKIVILEGD